MSDVTVVSATEGSLILVVIITGFTSVQQASDACVAFGGTPGVQVLSCNVISNICFPAGTEIKTDQGIIRIEKLKREINTILGKPIKHITETLSKDNYLMCFEKDALYNRYPSKRTIMSKEHKIEYNGQMVEAYKLENASGLVKRVRYEGEVLYNVLLEEHGVMEVNNLVCETLDPRNRIACEYNKTEYKEKKKENKLYKRELTKRI